VRLAWLVSFGLHASLFGVLALRPFGVGGSDPPRLGMARIGFASEECRSVESSEIRQVSEPERSESEAPPSTSVDLPLVALRTRPVSSFTPSTARVRLRRPAPVVLSSTEPVEASAPSQGAFAPPSPLHNTEPRYPAEARRRGWVGSVLLVARVAPDGACVSARVMESSGHRCLDEAALEAVRRWTFAPAVRDGAPVEAEVEVPVNFVLR